MTLGIRKSGIIYRIYYPTWQNQTITHDPLYIAYIGPPNFLNPTNPLSQTWLIATVAFSIAVLTIAVYRHTKIRASKLNNSINTQPDNIQNASQTVTYSNMKGVLQQH